VTIARRLAVLEQRILPPPAAPAREPFDWDGYAAWCERMQALSPEELAAHLCR
jgi:hypothetical protein